MVEFRDALRRRHPTAKECAYLESPGGQKTEIPASIFEVLLRVADDMAHGNAVVIVPIEHELTTQEAADILNVSRPHLINLLKNGLIDFHMAGTHRRVRFDDVMAFRRRRDAERQALLAEIADESARLVGGLEY